MQSILRLFRILLPFGVVCLFSACAMSPGMNGTDTNALESDVVKIDAELIFMLKNQELKNKSHSVQNSRKSQNIKSKQLISFQQSLNTRMQRYDYRIGPSDVLSIVVWGHPELTLPVGAERSAEQAGTLVGNDGTIYFPYAGVVNVEGMTLAEARRMLTEKLSQYIENVKLDIRIAEYNSKRVYVMGEVKNPSIQKITHIPPTVIEKINAAGGFTENADKQKVTVTRNDQVFQVNLRSLYENGDQKQNMLLRDGDVIHVDDHYFNKIFVLGEVNSPGSLQMKNYTMSLAEALGDSGGVNQMTSDPEHIYVLRSDQKGASIFHLNAGSAEALILADQFSLKPRDVIYVDSAKIVRWNRVLQNITGTLNALNNASSTDFPLFKGDVQ